MEEIIESFEISVKGLRSCYTSEGILAGKRNFVDYWARDSLFASLGCSAIGDEQQAKINLDLYLKNQKCSGHLPYRIISIDQFLKYLHINVRFKTPIPNYKSPWGDKVVDQNLLLVLAACEIFQTDSDQQYIKHILSQLELSLHWLSGQDKDHDGLIEEGFLANWMDHTKKKGKTLINNVLYFAALKKFIELCNEQDNCKLSEHYYSKLDLSQQSIEEFFWNEDYFIDWIDGKKHHYMDTAGNLIAVIYGLIDSDKSAKIMSKIEQYKGEAFIPKANYPYYRKRLIQPQLFLAGLADYAGYRIWIGALYALAWLKIGQVEKARQGISDIAHSIVQHQAVYEIYTPKGEPLRRWPAYKNEVPFAWSCGVYIWVVSQIYPNFKDWL